MIQKTEIIFLVKNEINGVQLLTRKLELLKIGNNEKLQKFITKYVMSVLWNYMTTIIP